ncbi:zinc finger domain-containing protein [Rhodococcus qingshengii]
MNNFEDLMNHDFALTVSCQECKSKIGAPCTRVDIKGRREPLVNFPAHRSRIKRAERIERLEKLDAERAAAKAAQ